MSHLELVLWMGLASGLAFGACGQITGFCLQRGLKEYWSGGDGYKLQAFAVALAIALLGTQALASAGLVDLGKSLYMMPTWSWLLVPAGGLMFGYGMGLANGCGARALVLLSQGNLRSFVVLICLGIAAYMTLTGILGPWRVALFAQTSISPPLLTVPDGWPRHIVAWLAAVALVLFALRSGRPGKRARDLAGGAIVGLLVAAGWFITGSLGADDFEPVPVMSLTFVAPIGDTLQYAMIATGMSLRFGIAVVAGVLGGAFLAAMLRGQCRLEGFESPRQMLRYMAGGVLMGVGGALAFGCSIGQGLTGLSTLSGSSLVAALAILAGARLAWKRPALQNALEAA
ncbi:YeeE/YedE family protein [Alcaligenaceae bacterium]|nr:YeeE/YedE family protein [Alcaligenaceae bacterium]